MSNTNVYENSIALTLSVSRLGIRRKVDSNRIEVTGATEQPDRDALAVSKELIDCPEYDAIVSYDNATRTQIMGLSVPAPFRRGIYLVPIVSVEWIEAILSNYRDVREEKVREFVAVYDAQIEAARGRLGELYNAGDYPDAGKVAASFSVRTSYLDLGVPGRLQQVNPDIFNAEKRKFEMELQNAAEEIRNGLRAAFAEIVDHMRDKLTTKPGGKKQIFRDSLLSNLTDFLDGFDARNIAQDDGLAALVDQARAIVAGKSPEMLRTPIVAETVRASLEEVKTKIDGLLTSAPGRKFDFTSEAAEAA